MTNEKAIEVLMWALNRLDGHNYIVDGYGTVDIRAKVDAFGMAIESLRHGSRHGRWKSYNDEWVRDDGSPVFISCSLCGNIVLNNASAVFNYCPHCGAKMDEVI